MLCRASCDRTQHLDFVSYETEVIIGSMEIEIPLDIFVRFEDIGLEFEVLAIDFPCDNLGVAQFLSKAGIADEGNVT
jgi:hypothetical protein